MTDAYIYDHVRTPRGKGRAEGALNEITPLQLSTQVLMALRDRSHLDTALIDDVVLGIVSPIGEQGSVLPRSAALNAGYGDGVPGVQVNRFCASGLEAVNTAADGSARTVRVQVLTPPGVLNRAGQKQLVSDATRIVAEACGDPTQARRTWVLLTEAAEGGWGIAGTAFGKEEFAALAAKKT